MGYLPFFLFRDAQLIIPREIHFSLRSIMV